MEIIELALAISVLTVIRELLHPLSQSNILGLLAISVCLVILAIINRRQHYRVGKHLEALKLKARRQKYYLAYTLLVLTVIIILVLRVEPGRILLPLTLAIAAIRPDNFSFYVESLLKRIKAQLAARGFMMNDIDQLLELKSTKTVILEKSAVLMAGQPKVVSVVPVGTLSGETSLAIAAALEQAAMNPSARAIIEQAKTQKLEPILVENITAYETLGGIEGDMLGRSVIIGSARFLAERQVDILPVSKWINITAKNNESAIFLAVEGKVEALIALKDDFVLDATQTIKYLNNQRYQTIALTGDNSAFGPPLKERLNLASVVSNKTTKEKAEYLIDLSSRERIAFVTGPGELANHVGLNFPVLIINVPTGLSHKPKQITLQGGLKDLKRLFESAGKLEVGLRGAEVKSFMLVAVGMLATMALSFVSPWLGLITILIIWTAGPRFLTYLIKVGS